MIIINPGTEPVESASLENATAAIQQFASELGIDGLVILRDPEQDHDGRFGFVLWRRFKLAGCEITMPGCDPDVTMKSQPWESPRLYVDGSSWLWGFAIGIAHGHLTGEE